MNTKIDLKSALLGLGLGVAVTVAVGAAASPGQVGRFQITGAGNHGAVLDTVTGQVWSMDLAGRGDKGFFAPKNAEKE